MPHLVLLGDGILANGAHTRQEPDTASTIRQLLPGWTGHEGVLRARQRHADSMGELPPVVHRLHRGEPALPTIYEES